METNQIVLIVLIVIGIVLIAVSFLLDRKEKNQEGDADIEALKQQLKDELDKVIADCKCSAQEEIEQSARSALASYTEEAKREIEVAQNEAEGYMEKLVDEAKAQMEAYVKQTMQETDGIQDDLKHDLETMTAAQTEQVQKKLDDTVSEIQNHYQEVLALYSMINGKQEELDDSITRIHIKAAELEQSVDEVQRRTQEAADNSDALFSGLTAQVRDEVVSLLNEQMFAEAETLREDLSAAKNEAEAVKREVAAELARIEAEEKAAKEAAEREAEEKAAKEAAEREAEEKAAKEAAEREAEEKAAKEAAEREAEEKAAKEAAEREAEEKAAKEAAEREAEEKAAKDVAEDLNATKAINREELRDALQALEHAQKAAAAEETEIVSNEQFMEDEIDIDDVFVADVEEFESIATETVREGIREALDEEESGRAEFQEDTQKAESPERKAPSGYRVMRTVLQKGTEPEEIPEDMVLEDEPNKMLKAVRGSGTVSTEADLEMRKKVLRMYDKGHSSMDIAEALKLGIGEVRMIIDLYSRRER